MPVVINGSTGISGTDGSASTPAVQGTDTNTGLFFPAADTIAFAEGGTEVMRIDSAGNVGVGTPSPAYRLDVQGGATRVYRAGADALSAVENNSTFNSYTAYINSSGTFDVGKGNGVAFLAANGAQPLIVNTNASERMRIDASGNVGIGTSSPSSYGNGLVVFNAATGVIRAAGGSVTSYMFASNGGGVAAVGTESNHPFAFYTNNAERARITSGGQLFTTIDGTSSVMADYGCRAWVNFNGVANPPTIRGSGNVSSITDNGTGSYTVNFASAMPDVNYSAQALGDHVPGVYESRASIRNGTVATGSVRIDFHNGGNAPVDVTTACVAIFR